MTQPTFTTTELANDRVLVSGLDHVGTLNQVILDGEEYNALKRRDAQILAGEEFDAALEEFYAPLVAAADKAKQASKVVHDPAFFVVMQEAEEGTEAKPQVLHFLQQDTVVLRLIEAGNLDRLVWVNGSIEVLAAAATAPAVTPEVVNLVETTDELKA